ncbi:MAG: ArsR/SmtB family transcription factor [Promethearchaeota archaeon]
MNSQYNKLINLLNLLADNTRLDILNLLKEKERTSAEIQEILNKSQSTISQQLKMLRENQLIDYKKVNNINYYFIKNDDIFKLLAILQAFIDDIEKNELWERSKRDLEDLLL